MHILKMSLGNKVTNHQKNKGAEHPLFQNTGVKKLNGFKTEVKGILFDMTDSAIEYNSPANFFKFYAVKKKKQK